MNPKIKICGLNSPENIRDVLDLQPDYAGFIFHPTSKRFIGDLDAAWVAELQGPAIKTGVFVDAQLERIRTTIHQYRLAAVQLHGNETPEYCTELRNLGIEIIKAFGISDGFDWSALAAYEAVADYYLFDTKSPQHGGTGMSFDWKLLEGYRSSKPFFLSGGLSADNIHDAVRLGDDRLYALDLNSRFETEPGIKNIELLKRTLQNINDE
ncbi:phosphoribosylanthranilate isomerase [Parapedobacter sp. ISTM3]|uniref:phosphoribosylanthranilate isomerase n=1 Tax=Parapedobacter sp. ISTM3 TaxID=2800130 RepID=UPI001905953A|nr:phosphoribosylanthranilate isomerase [Parapedobacter sp. ISTM3]MBK1439030.1 phosphoribosylanthranilate isomerase [Parapedobacter sp. ISTM3]